MLKIDEFNSPVIVDISISPPQAERYSFYTPAFFSRNNTAKRDVEVEDLKQVLDAGYDVDSPAYAWCSLAFKQEDYRVDSIILVAQRDGETLLDSFKDSEFKRYYFISSEEHDVDQVLELSTYLKTIQKDKLIFITKYEDLSSKLMGIRNIVWWWSTNFWFWDSNAIVVWDSGYDMESAIYNYPEAAWISRCGSIFPSQVQWLCKELIDVPIEQPFFDSSHTRDYIWDIEQVNVLWDSGKDVTSQHTADYNYQNDFIPPFKTPSTWYMDVLGYNVTWGSGTTCNGEWIDNIVTDDWMKWAIQRNIWKLFKLSPKVNATQDGLEKITLKITEVLNFLIDQNGIRSYRITKATFDRLTRSSSFEFEYEREHAIIGVRNITGKVSA